MSQINRGGPNSDTNYYSRNYGRDGGKPTAGKVLKSR
jgi:hypothetical protein